MHVFVLYTYVPAYVCLSVQYLLVHTCCMMFKCSYPRVILLLVDHSVIEQITVDGGACVRSYR